MAGVGIHVAVGNYDFTFLQAGSDFRGQVKAVQGVKKRGNVRAYLLGFAVSAV